MYICNEIENKSTTTTTTDGQDSIREAPLPCDPGT